MVFLANFESQSSYHDEAVVMVRSPVEAASGAVQYREVASEGAAVGPEIPGAYWESFQHIGCAELGGQCVFPRSYIAGTLWRPQGAQAIVMREHEVLAREGLPLDGLALKGPVLAMDVNGVGDYGLVWLTKRADASELRDSTAAFVNGTLVCRSGMPLLGRTGAVHQWWVSHVFPHIAIGDRRSDGSYYVYVHVLGSSQETVGFGAGEEMIVRYLRNDGVPAPCLADVNFDGGADGADVQEFFERWAAGESDLNCDGGTDGGDIAVFMEHWEAGC
ncbi:MAG: hypothetical protein JSR77_12150 [Planctomycetes bacterium]|nr:hypothetical protein [Planctomycetota bacterium]